MQILSTLNLTKIQQQVMAIALNGDPSIRLTSVNQVTARNELIKLGLMTYAANEMQLTNKGQAIAAQNNIADEQGSLTDHGQELLPQTDDAAGQADQMDQGMGDMGMGADPAGMQDGDPSMQQDDIQLQSLQYGHKYSLLKELLDL